MDYIYNTLNNIKNAKNDARLVEIIANIVIDAQYDSSILAEAETVIYN